MRDFAKNCAIVWSCLCAAWAIFGFAAGGTGSRSTGGTIACCGGASLATAFVAWVIGLVPCALLAVIAGPSRSTETPAPTTPKIPQKPADDRYALLIALWSVLALSIVGLGVWWASIAST